MRYNDLITDPIELFEAELTPGQVKSIELKIQNYEEELRKLRRQKMELDDKFIYGNFPKQLKDKVNAYIDAYSKAIYDLESKLKNQGSSKQFENFIAGIKKNCSEILVPYKQMGKMFYAGFKNSENQTALYSKPNAKLELGSHYPARHGTEIQELIERLFPEVSFNNAILVNSDAYEVSQGSRTPFMIFPRNGFKFFWSQDQSQLAVADAYMHHLFDSDLLIQAWETFIGDPAMYQKFIAAGGELESPYNKKEYIGTSDGFMGRWSMSNNLRTIAKLVAQGDVDSKWSSMANWTSLVSKNSFQKFYDLKTDEIARPLGYAHDCVINTSGVYGIHFQFRKQVLDALGIGTY